MIKSNRLSWFFACCILASLLGTVFALVEVVERLKGFEDVDFVVDWEDTNLEIGTALRRSRAGILGDRPRFYIVYAKSKSTGRIITLYEGDPAYPDVPLRPVFVDVSSGNIRYAPHKDAVPNAIKLRDVRQSLTDLEGSRGDEPF